MKIRPMRADESEVISALAIRSKAHWPYTDEQIEIFRDELTVRPEQVVPGRACVIEDAGGVQGFYTLEDVTDQSGAVAADEIELGHLFVEPAALRSGFGRMLLTHARETAATAGYRFMKIQSDPNAAGFYESAGARFVCDVPTSIPGRTLPCYRLDLT